MGGFGGPNSPEPSSLELDCLSPAICDEVLECGFASFLVHSGEELRLEAAPRGIEFLAQASGRPIQAAPQLLVPPPKRG